MRIRRTTGMLSSTHTQHKHNIYMTNLTHIMNVDVNWFFRCNPKFNLKCALKFSRQKDSLRTPKFEKHFQCGFA